MKIGLANDHTAREMKAEVIAHLEKKGYEVVDFGCNDVSGLCDYPIYAEKLGRAVVSGEVDLGIAICGTGIGMSIAVNKVKGVRCCVCSEPYSSKLSRMHNDSNVLAFGARVVGIDMAKMIMDSWLDAEFMGTERHQNRINMISDMEERF